MAATTSAPVTLDTPIVIKVLFRGQTRKLKLPLKDLGANVLPEKVRCTLELPDGQAGCRLISANSSSSPELRYGTAD
jgi:next-to-BRCA1 protein 1